MDKTIFVVDDSITNLAAAAETLEDSYRVLTMTSATKMFSMLKQIIPSLILLDIEMPGINGMDALRLLKSDPEHVHIPVIFLTSVNDVEVETRGFENGAFDFIPKPFSPPVLKSRIKACIDIDSLVKGRTEELLRRTAQLERLRGDIIIVLADLIESRDKNTGGHIERVKFYTKNLIEAMIKKGVYREEMKDWDLELVYISTKMHDIGKIAISDSILNKPGKLTFDEFEIIKTHVKEGVRIIEEIAEKTEYADFLKSAHMFAAYHHEKWDGTGYPYKLSGEDIPLQGRIMALVDVYDALTSVRPYKVALPAEDAAKIINKGSGSHFDPAIVDVFNGITDIFENIQMLFSGKRLS